MKKKQIFADVFGTQFPVCSQEQADKLKAAYDSAKARMDSGELPIEKHMGECMCDLISSLLNGDADAATQAGGATFIAEMMLSLYREAEELKDAGDQLQSLKTLIEAMKQASFIASTPTGRPN